MRENNELTSPGTQLQPRARSSKELTMLGLARWIVTGGVKAKRWEERDTERGGQQLSFRDAGEEGKGIEF